MKRILGFGVVVLVACAPRISAPARTALDVDVFAAADRGWESVGLGQPGACLARARIEVARSESEFRRRCLLSACVSAAACWLDEEKVALFSPAREIEPGGEPGVHEAMHGLTRCHLPRARQDPYDAGHTNPRVWLQAGGATSAQARAREAYDGR